MSYLRLIAIIAAVTVLVAVWAYLNGRWDGSSACDDRHARVAAEAMTREREIADKHAKALEAELTQSRQYAARMERLVSYEIEKHGADYACVLPASGLRLLNDAIAGRAAAKPDDRVQ